MLSGLMLASARWKVWTMPDPAYRPDLEPGFWPNWQEPTPLAQAIQYPLNDPNWHNRVINAYMKTANKEKKEKKN